MNHSSALPTEEIPDAGPKQRAAAGTWFLALTASLVAGLFLYGWHGETAETSAALMLLAAVLFAMPAAWGWWSIVQTRTASRDIQSGCHYLLIEHLKFIIKHTICDTAVTAFFRPDSPGPGGATCLLIFLENYSSRRRHVRIRLGSCAALDLPRQSQLDLVVLAGQAVVYRWPLRVHSDARPGDYDLRLRLSVKAVNGLGRVLGSFSGKKHKADNTLALTSADLRLHPGFRVAANGAALTEPTTGPGFLALASPIISQPRFHLLRQISENSPAQPVAPDSLSSTPPWTPGTA